MNVPKMFVENFLWPYIYTSVRSDDVGGGFTTLMARDLTGSYD